jgi:hypothetical protein
MASSATSFNPPGWSGFEEATVTFIGIKPCHDAVTHPKDLEFNFGY